MKRRPREAPASELSARHQELSAIYENVPGILFYVSVDPDGEFRFQSMSHAGLIAMGLTREQVVGRLVREVIPPPSLDLVLSYYREALQSGKAVKWKEVSEYPAGRKVGEVAVTPLYDIGGNATHLIGIVHDITERERLEDSLQGLREVAHNRELKLLLETSTQGVVSVDEKGKIVTANRALELMFGWRRSELIGKPIERLLPTALREKHEKHRTDYFASPHARLMGGGLQLVGERKDGSTFPIEVSLNHVVTSEGPRAFAFVTDITEKQWVEEKLREYERAVEGAEEMIVVVDREYRYRIANRKFLKMREMTGDQVLGHHARDVLNEGVFDSVVKPKLDECFQGKVVRYEMKYSYPLYGEKDISVSYFPVEGPRGVDRVVCIVHDITERKQAERTLATFSRKLIEAEEHERTRIARELHDNINQRLALLRVELDRAHQTPPSSAEDLKQFLVELQRRVADLSYEVQSLSHGLHSSQLEYIGIAAAMKGFCREFAQRQTVNIDFACGDIPAHLPSEVSLCLFRVLQEALQNAAKHSNSKEFKVKLDSSVGRIGLLVADPGTGFDLAAVMHKGGLGLISMRERVLLLNGTITIDSKPMCGTTVHVRVPFAPERTP